MALLPNPRALISFLLALVCIALAAGCNDTLRQFIIQVPPPSGDSCTSCGANAVVLSTNPAGNGSTLHIDVTGDTVVGIAQTGPNPVFLGGTPARVFVINGDNTLTTYATIAQAPIGTIGTATQPSTAVGSIAGGFSSNGTFYVANMASNNISLLALVAGGAGVTGTVGVTPSVDPVAIAGNSANNKVYVINNASNDVSVLSSVDNTIQTTIPVGNHPVWGVMSTDGVHVFVVNQGDGTVSVIDTLLDKVICSHPQPCTTTVSVGTTASPQPNFAFYDPKLQRVYVTNTGENTVSVIKANGIDLANGIVPTKLADIPVSGAPISVTALSDGSRAYAALANCPAGTNQTTLLGNLAACTGNLVSVIDATTLRESKTIPVGAGAVAIESARDGSRVYVVSALDTTTIADNVNTPAQPSRTFATPSISIINTTGDIVLSTPVDPSVVSRPLPTFHAPQQDRTCKAVIDSTFNTKVPMPCAEQTPFSVKMFP